MSDDCEGCADPKGEIVAVTGAGIDAALCRGCRRRTNRLLAAWGEETLENGDS